MDDQESPDGAAKARGTFAQQREAHLQADAQSWDATRVEPAKPGDIPVINISGADSDPARMAAVVEQIGQACRHVGFYSLVGHGITPAAFDDVFASARRFHAQTLDTKMLLAMDQPGLPSGVGYLPVQHRKLPRRAQGNANEAFIVKRDTGLSFDANPWPGEDALPGFRASIVKYAEALEALALRLLPFYAQALHMPADFFRPGFADPLLRLRLTHYPPSHLDAVADSEFGIAPHVDTTFFTLLAQDQPGLAVYSEDRECWIAVPKVEGALVVNTGELLKQWSNDEFISVKHFANNTPNSIGDKSGTEQSRYSVPLFFNATSSYPMTCVPSCCSSDRPPQYPAISYNQSQGVVQGE